MNAHASDLQPNLNDINAHLFALYRPAWTNSYPDAYIQIAYGHPHSGGDVNQAQIYPVHELKDIAAFVAKRNALGYNVYTSPVLLHFPNRTMPPDRRVKEDKYLASAFAWVEFDGAGDADRVNTTLMEKGIIPALIVTTGTVPHVRMHVYFKVADIRDAGHQKQVNKALQNLLGTDNVSDACRPMRIAGSVNYPTKQKADERGYVAEVTTFRQVSDGPTYRAEQLIALASIEESDQLAAFAAFGEQFGRKTGKSDDELTALLKQSRATPGKGWRDPMLRFIGSTVGKGWSDLQIKLACAPYSDGGIDDRDIRELIDYTRKKFGKPDTEDAATEQPQAPESKAKASSALALVYYDDLSDPPPKCWIIKSVLARGETSNWFGPPGVGKSVLMTDLAFHAASGCDWRGNRSKERCGVVYIALERGALVKRRLSAYMRKYGVTDLPIAIASNVVDLKNKSCVKVILDTVREAEARFRCKVGLIVIDTISKGIAAGGGDEDKAKDVNIVLANLRRVEELTPVHIACVGHTGKDEGRGHRGSNANLGDVDLMVQISGDGGVKTATVIKINDGMEGPLTHYKLESALLGTDEDGDPITTAIISDDASVAEREAKTKVGLSDAQRRALELLTRCINDHGRPPPPSREFPQNVRVVLLNEWQAMCERGSLSAAEKKADRDKAFRRAWEGLQTKLRIACLDGWVWLVRDDD
ncbi:AAA family ATPase [Bradyrhizobium sp. SHOUNA76]|uniref:AAA family ATPase n=1 Tax=Bradyrhizobium sp. SHOUNA76 TaxID=2908927 RepID=UPI001FF4CEAB|nr:AAA family ATPase [Bradyrhizobium sp. SHOUNA76]MCJ9700868.1 helicase RepA family protein [Bradyrhizobium sp. SHOUNA76]